MECLLSGNEMFSQCMFMNSVTFSDEPLNSVSVSCISDSSFWNTDGNFYCIL